MKLAFGILALLVGLWFLGGILGGLRPRYSPFMRQMRRAHHLGDLVNGTLLVIMFCGTGAFLLADFHLWWVLLPICAVIIALWSRLLW
jgi:hypothetical protein